MIASIALRVKPLCAFVSSLCDDGLFSSSRNGSEYGEVKANQRKTESKQNGMKKREKENEETL